MNRKRIIGALLFAPFALIFGLAMLGLAITQPVAFAALVGGMVICVAGGVGFAMLFE